MVLICGYALSALYCVSLRDALTSGSRTSHPFKCVFLSDELVKKENDYLYKLHTHWTWGRLKIYILSKITWRNHFYTVNEGLVVRAHLHHHRLSGRNKKCCHQNTKQSVLNVVRKHTWSCVCYLENSSIFCDKGFVFGSCRVSHREIKPSQRRLRVFLLKTQSLPPVDSESSSWRKLLITDSYVCVHYYEFNIKRII